MILTMMKMTLKLLFMSEFCLGIVNLEKAKDLNKDINKELMLIMWDPRRYWNFFMTEDEKKEIGPIFTD